MRPSRYGQTEAYHSLGLSVCAVSGRAGVQRRVLPIQTARPGLSGVTRKVRLLRLLLLLLLSGQC